MRHYTAYTNQTGHKSQNINDMHIRTLILLAFVFSFHLAQADQLKIHPYPQSVTASGKRVSLKTGITLTGADQADAVAVRKLQETPGISETPKGLKIHIGEKGSKAVKKYAHLIPDVTGGYYLSIDDKQIVIAGHNGEGTFYAVQTLSQLLHDGTLPEVEITDYPDVAYRGVVEGFYGQPWSHQDRLRQLDFYGANKLNTYIYGPKDDPYHSSPNWRKPYPEQEGRQIGELVKAANANKVNFVWAIHPGQDIRWNDEDVQALIHKFQMMYDLGVRSFAVFFDDISGTGTDPNRQAELLNTIHRDFITVKKDVTPLIMCPTEYNKSWANPKPGTYLDILGEKLHPTIQIMWTGDRVVSDITREGMEWINKRIKRPAYIWWNFPVSDYVRDHLLLGASYGLDTDIAKEMSGFVSNPMDKAESSKIALYSIADYTWNMKAYNFRESWENAIRYVMPGAAEAFRTFASHNSDPGRNGHGYRRDESTEIKPVIEQFTKTYQNGNLDTETLNTIVNEFQKIQDAPGRIVSQGDPYLVKEIEPWLEQFGFLGQSGLAITKLLTVYETRNVSDSWNQYNLYLQSDRQQQAIDRQNNRNPYQPGVKSGSLVMQPFINDMAQSFNRRMYYQLTGREAETSILTAPLLTTDIKQLKKLTLQATPNSVSITPVLEVVKIAPQQFVGMELPTVNTTATLSMNLNTANVLQWGKIQFSSDGQQWEEVKAVENTNGITVDLKNKPVKHIRLVNAGTNEKEIYLKNFTLDSKNIANENDRLKAADQNLATAYTLVKGSTIFVDNTRKQRPEKVFFFIAPGQATDLQVIAIDKHNTRHTLSRITTPYAVIDLTTIPQEVKRLEIQNPNSDIDIHEIIWGG